VADVAAASGAVAVRADVTDSEALTAGLDDAVGQLGRLDGVVVNAGVGNLKRLEDYNDAEFVHLINVNLNGAFFTMRAAFPHLRSAGGGAIVTVASVSGVRPTRGEGPYSAAKAGLIALTESAALEWGPDVRVNCVSPGFIRTPLNDFLLGGAAETELAEATPLGRVGELDDVASVIEFLLSPAASYLTGQNLVVDGGSMLPSHQVDPLLGRLLRGDTSSD
jgi:NAD(P)-dependent dehydrogenase (short-subunit alcohol dehydrogenase family)